MAKSRLKDFSQFADGAYRSGSQKEMILEAEIVSSETISTHQDQALKIVRRNMGWSMGMGLIPIPIVDLVGIVSVQIRALKQLSDLYEIPFRKNRVRSLLASLIGGLGACSLGGWASRSFLKSIPLVGRYVGLISTPVFAGAISYAVGKVFIQHFESGGTFLTFDPKQVRAYFNKQFEEGLKVSAQL